MLTFRVVRVSTHKRSHGKETATHVWSCNLLILAFMQVYPRKERPLTVEHLFGVQIVSICHKLFELCMRERKERKIETKKERNKQTKEHRNKRRRTELKFSRSIFSTERRINGMLGVYFTIEYMCFHLHEFCITLLHLSWCCFQTLSTGPNFEPAQFLIEKYIVLQ